MPDLSRRTLLQTGLAGAAATLTGCSLLPRRSAQQKEYYAGALQLADGSYAVGAIDRRGQPLWQSPVSERCHSGCWRPDSSEVVVFERRPGWSFYVIDGSNGERLRQVSAAAGEHFVGHGIFDQQGRLLYAPASRYEPGEGIIAVYDGDNGYERVGTLELGGIGPHQLTLHPDGRTLIVGLGGILTHPDYDRLKLNLDTMESSLMLMDRFSGEVLARFQPSLQKLSCRHVDVSPAGHIYAAYQYQGPRHETPPLVASYRNGHFREIDFGTEVLAQLGNYIASVVAHPENEQVAIASPVGGTALIFDGVSGEVLETLRLPDCSGVEALSGGDFLVSSGQGKLVRMGSGGNSGEIARMPVHWDHHLV